MAKPNRRPAKQDDADESVTTQDLTIRYRRIIPSKEWRERLGEAKQMAAEELCDVVYAMAREGATLGLIAAYYGIDPKALGQVAGDAWNMANAELVLEIFRDQIMTALHTKQMLAKIYVGKQFAGQRDAQPLNADINATDDVGGLTINVNVAKSNRDENGKTREEASLGTDPEPTSGNQGGSGTVGTVSDDAVPDSSKLVNS